MLVFEKADVFLGARVVLNTGEVAEVVDDHPHREMVMVLVDGEDEPRQMLVGEACNPLWDREWIKELAAQQTISSEPEYEADDLQQVDLLTAWFDERYIDENTFDGDMLEIM